MFKNTKAIVFDLDDTLYLQRHYKESGFIAVADWLEIQLNINPKVTSSHLAEILNEFGPSYQYMFDRLIERMDLESTLLPRLIKVFLNHKLSISCYDEVTLLLPYLAKRYKLGLLTDGNHEVQRKKIEALHLEHIFNEIVLSDTLKLSKPDTYLYKIFEEKFGCFPRNLVYIGDNPKKDFIEAKNRGWQTIRILKGEYADITTNIIYDAQLKIHSLSELFDIF